MDWPPDGEAVVSVGVVCKVWAGFLNEGDSSFSLESATCLPPPPRYGLAL